MLEHFGQDRLPLFRGQIVFSGQCDVEKFQFGLDRFERDPLRIWCQVLKSRENGQLLAIGDDLRQVSTMETPIGLSWSLQNHELVGRRADAGQA